MQAVGSRRRQVAVAAEDGADAELQQSVATYSFAAGKELLGVVGVVVGQLDESDQHTGSGLLAELAGSRVSQSRPCAQVR